MATRKRRRRISASPSAIIRRRWKRGGRTVLEQRPPEEPVVKPKERRQGTSLLSFPGSPSKAEYYDTLGYPKMAQKASRYGQAVVPLVSGSTSVLYVVQSGDTLEGIAQTFHISLASLIAANPEMSPSEHIFPGQVITVPVTESALPPQGQTLIPYVAQLGQSLFSIAARFGVSLSELVRVNPQIGSEEDIYAGQIVWIPTVPDAPVSQSPAILFVVQPGDTLGAIGLRFNVSRDELVAANPQLLDPDVLYPGEIIVVPVSGVPTQPVFDHVRYVIQPGDTIESIAGQFMVTLASLQSVNPLLLAIPGLTLIIPAGVPIPAPPQPVPGARRCHPPPFGRALELGDDDFSFVPFGNGFTFPFYGESFTGLFVNSNGSITFGEGDPNFFPMVDTFVEGAPRIAPFWADLNPATGVVGSGVFVAAVASDDPSQARVIVTWDRTPYFFTDVPNTVQLSLFGDGNIQMCYFEVANPPEPRPVLIGVARGQGEPESNIFRYDGAANPRRTGNPQEPTPTGSLTGRILRYIFVPETGNYRLEFVEG